MEIWGFIPARKGSKGIKDKNVARVLDKELIRYTFEEAVKSERLNRVFISTDDERVLSIAKDYPKVEAPFNRPAELAKDDVKTADVLFHFLGEMKSRPDYVVLLQPTAPLRSAADIDESISVLLKSRERFDSLVSVAKIEEPHPHKLKKIEDGMLVPFLSGGNSETPRQSLPEVYKLNGAIYIIDTQVFLKTKSFFSKTMPFVMDDDQALNIDRPEDLVLLEYHLKKRMR